jgi:anti-anti-sigma factor
LDIADVGYARPSDRPDAVEDAMAERRHQHGAGIGAGIKVRLPHEIELSNAPIVEDQLRAVIESSNGLLAVDCSDLRFIDDRGIDTLVSSQRFAEARAVRLVWCGLSGPPLSRITQSQLDLYLNVELSAAAAPEDR